MAHNENDKLFIISEKGGARMNFHYRWEHEERHRRGLRNPWTHRPDKPIRYEEIMRKFAGTDIEMKGKRPIYKNYTDEEMEAWKIERDEYMRQRDEWIALQMFNRYGYEAFLDECNNLSEVFQKSIFPCESNGDPQCSMFCSAFKDCPLRGREGGGEASDY